MFCPPIGNFRTAVSGIESATQKKDWVRNACWTDSWCCPGTTSSDDPQKRSKFLVWFQSKGPPYYHHELRDPPDDPDLKWTTFELRPEPSGEPAASEDEDRPEPDEEPAGLQDIHNVHPGGRKHPHTTAKSKPSRGSTYAASSMPVPSAASASASTVLLPPPAEPDDASEEVTHAYPTRRERRVRRTQRLHDRYRSWTEDADEAGSPLSYHLFSS